MPMNVRDRAAGQQARDALEVGDRGARRCRRASRGRRPSRPAPRGCAVRAAARAPAARCRRTSPRRTTSPISVVERVAADGLEAALRVGELRPQHGAQDAVVAARDELALRAAHDPRAVREARADREVRVAGHQRRDQRQQPAQVGREVDVHVGHDLRRAGRPGRAQRAPAALLLQAQVTHARQRQRQPAGDLRRRIDRRVVGDHDPPAEREAVARGSGAAGGCCARDRRPRCTRERRSRRRAPPRPRARAEGRKSERGGELGHDLSIGSPARARWDDPESFAESASADREGSRR